MSSNFVENRRRQIDNNLGIFTQALMWFIDGAVTEEKLGIIKLMLCNINGDSDCSDHIKEKINPMIDTIKNIIDDIQENKKYVDLNSRQQIWHRFKSYNGICKAAEKVEAEKREKKNTEDTETAEKKSIEKMIQEKIKEKIQEKIRSFVDKTKTFALRLS